MLSCNPMARRSYPVRSSISILIDELSESTWWANTDIALIAVFSWPPPATAVLMNKPTCFAAKALASYESVGYCLILDR
jgi:hypothetical protein